ncbi:alpha/beta fold hydrolase [Haemophilus influenzae]|uniref:alpha/beta fold hydrolase n=1 Tax=Haemophilus influenzae TaxID=727 RepID=UPI0001A3F7FC|nr:alpha/beta hydrolase [Haemophilus influenzae]CVQ14787.1 lysophospholipase L2 [Streptococcus pneumoniae]EEP47138.1 probable lysophospholipase L2 [Haemophilus influenzae 6P18H1]MBK1414111.1 alpha/beta hydrolase [Haemophilus influenzae]MCK8898550.1 alpha/beta hydrolase [Haemophilus influenzae]MCK8934263.1 alpha/beta hydrolase [Haemophilus influenzae]
MIREPYFHQFALAELLPFFEQFPTQYLSGKRNIKLAYRHLIQSESAVRKLMILVNGRAENMLKWSELAYDFYHQGYDVLLFDHRGQGYSQRIIPQKGHLDEFRFYVDDMAKIIEKVTALFSYSTQHLLAHSMGALIATYYLANYDHHINKAVLSSPFYGILLKHPIRDELIITLMNILGQGERYVFGKGPYQQAHLEYNELTFCKTRMKWMNRVNRKNPAINLGGPTFRWVHLCLNAIKRLPKVIPKIEIPILILQAEKEKIVDNNNLEKLTALFPNARCEVVFNAKHEILFEQDKLRKKTIFKMLEFLNN